MSPESFAYWLQGYSEITGGKTPSEEEWVIIRDHLKLVFEKKTPNRQVPSPNVGVQGPIFDHPPTVRGPWAVDPFRPGFQVPPVITC